MDKEIKKVNKEIKKLLISNDRYMNKVISWAIKMKGKQIRPRFAVVSSRYGTDMGLTIRVAALIEVLHVASLVHDDIVDDSDIRRGIASVQKKYGKAMAVYAGDYMVFSALGKQFESTDKIRNEWIHKLYFSLRKVLEGEMRQNCNLYNSQITEGEYISIVEGKTGTMFSLACEMGARTSGAIDNIAGILEKYGNNFGLLFQIKDDLLDFYSNPSDIGKPVLHDFENGVYTLPIIYCMENSQIRNRIVELGKYARKRGMTAEEKNELLSFIESERAVDRCRELAGDIYIRTAPLLSELPKCVETEYFKKNLEKLYKSI